MRDKKLEKKVRRTFSLQHDQSDCGVACLLSVVRYYGGNSSLERLRELSGTSKQGTTLLGLFQAANQLGFKAEGYEADSSSLIAHNQPVILLIQNEFLNHYIVCYGMVNDKFLIGDPANGVLYYSKSELEQKWQTKACLTLAPDNTFIKVQDIKKDKRKWLFSLLDEDCKFLAYTILLGIITASLGLTMAVFSQKLIDNILPLGNMRKLIAGIALVAFLLLLRTVLDGIRNWLIIRQTRDFNNRITDNFYSSLLLLPKLFFDTRKIGELIARLNDTQRVQRVIASIVGTSMIDLLTVLSSFVIMFYYSWEVGVFSLISLPFYFSLIYFFNNNIILTHRRVMQSYALSQGNYIVSMQGIADVKNHNCTSFFRRLNQAIYGDFQDKIVQLGEINIKLSILSGVFCVFFLVSALIYTSSMVFNNQMKTGELIAILGILTSLLPAVAGLALIAIPMNEAKVAFDRMYEFASLKPELKGTIIDFSFNSLEVKHLAFRFAGQKQLLKDISLNVRKGECVAIIGESGCGKSTFIQILQKFYPFESGNITVNGSFGLFDINTEYWRNIIGVIPQDISIFNGTLMDNILLGKEYEPFKMERFLSEYKFMSFIQSLPQGGATILGEEGIKISGGQKQLIALMRVLYRKPQLLILDEFTSSMDRDTERFVLQLLLKIKSETAVLIVSHRLYSLGNIADCIYIFSNGVISNWGTHNQLLLTSNLYSDCILNNTNQQLKLVSDSLS